MSKIVLLSEFKREKQEEENEETVETSFEDIMEANRKKKEKAAKDRVAANRGVLRSYRIKN